MERRGVALGRLRSLLVPLGLIGLLLGAPALTLGAPAVGFPLQSSQASPVTGAVTISAPAVVPEAGLLGVQFKVDSYVLDALDPASPFQVVWSAASATDGDHTITAEARYASGVVIESAPLLLTVANPTTFNRTLYVDAAAGNDANSGLTQAAPWRTLDRANSAVVAGDTVRLRGTFSAQSIAPSVSGTAARPIRFTSYPGETAVLDAGNSGVALWLNARSYVVVEGLRIQNVPGYAVLWEAGAHHNVLRAASIVDTSNAPGTWGHAIKIEGSSDNLVEQTLITNVGHEADNSGDSIYIVSGAHRNRILGNTLRNGGHSLIQMGSQQSTAMSSDNVIAGNTISNFYTTPIILAYGTDRTLIEYNRISDGARNGVNYPRPGIQMVSSGNIIRYNEICDNAAGGIALNAYVYNGTIPQDSIGNQIYHNVFYRNNRIQDFVNDSGALHIRESDGRSVRDNFIANNIFLRNDGLAVGGDNYAITVDHYRNPTAWPAGSLNGNRIENNIILRQPGASGLPTVLRIRTAAQGGNLSHTLAGFQQTYAGASGNLEVDPLFTNEASLVFTLRAGSPAIDRGLLIPGVPFLGPAPDLGVFEYATGPPPDTTPPTVSLVSPTGGQTVSGVLTITASASDNVGVTRLDYLQNGQILGTFSPPVYTFAWNTATVSNGSHSLSARAYDAAGNVATSAAVAVTVSNTDTTPPTVTITTPTANPTYTASTSPLTLGGTASDNVGVTQVTWLNSRGGSGTATGTTSWTASGIALQPGANVLTLTARDAAGNSATDSVTVTLPDSTPPTVTITTPTANPTYTASSSPLTLGGTASDSVGGLGVFAWTDPTITPGSTPAKLVHLTELRTALNQVYQAAGRATPTYTDPTGAAGLTVIKALHLNELRSAVRALQ